MSGYRRHNGQGHENYLINHTLNMSGTYDGIENQEFGYSGSGPYSFPQQPFSSYASQFGSAYGQPSTLSRNTSHLSTQYSSGQSLSQLSPQNQILAQGSQQQSPQYMSQSRYLHSPRYLPVQDPLRRNEIESQESLNEIAMLSEPVIPPLEGFPDAREFDQLMKSYVDDLSVKKQDKALIHAKRARNIRTVLMDPKDTAVESAQFRFWVKKMFKLQVVDSRTPDCKMICHEGKPVAIREKLFKILTKAHQQCQHGGRDKTSAQVRRIYSWVPKELISRFVKICPTCQVRRGGSRLTPPNSRRCSPRLESSSHSPSPVSRRESIVNQRVNLKRSQPQFSAQAHSHSNWEDSHQHLHEQLNIDHGPIHSFGTEAMNTLTSPIPTPLDPLTGELSLSSAQVNYGSGYATAHGNSAHHGF